MTGTTNNQHEIISHDTRIIEELGLAILAKVGINQPKSLDGRPIAYAVETVYPAGKSGRPVVATDNNDGISVNGKPTRTVRIFIGTLDNRAALVEQVAVETIKAAFTQSVRKINNACAKALEAYGYDVQGNTKKGYKVNQTEQSQANDAELLATVPAFKCGAIAAKAQEKREQQEEAKAAKADAAEAEETKSGTKMKVTHELTFESACAFIAKEIAAGNHTGQEAIDIINKGLRMIRDAQDVAKAEKAAEQATKSTKAKSKKVKAA